MADKIYPKVLDIRLVTSADSPEFSQLIWTLTHSSIVALDAEWKPIRARHDPFFSSFPTVTLLQLACRLGSNYCDDEDVSVVFLLDLLAIPLSLLHGHLRNVFISPDVLKLGFHFKQDLAYLSSTFSSQKCDFSFDRVEPFIDITVIYSILHHKQLGKKVSMETKSLATICNEVLGICLSKELQCSDWSQRPLAEEQKKYAAADAHCLLEIFRVFQCKFMDEELQLNKADHSNPSFMDVGLKDFFRIPDNNHNNFLRRKISEASDILQTSATEIPIKVQIVEVAAYESSCENTIPIDLSLLKIVSRYGNKILLKDSDKKPKISKKKKQSVLDRPFILEKQQLQNFDDWQGLCPWDLSLGGDGSPKFLCDVMVEGLAKQLRCVGIDAAIPISRKPETRALLDQARREKRVLLTRDAKILKHGYLIQNQLYKVKSLLKNDQLLEVIQTYQLKISRNCLLSRCTKCNGKFIQKRLTDEAIEASKRFKVIPNCLFDKNLEFWQCLDCHQLYWEGSQYRNAVEKFVNICKLSD